MGVRCTTCLFVQNSGFVSQPVKLSVRLLGESSYSEVRLGWFERILYLFLDLG